MQIHKDRGQALVEFLTPEDASAALSFDGSDFSGSILRIRRPKDYVELVVRINIQNFLPSPFSMILSRYYTISIDCTSGLVVRQT